MRHSLTGLRIAVTRPASGPGEDRLVTLLRERGAEPVELPTARTEPVLDPRPLREAAGRILEYDWLVLTSARAVPPFLEALRAAGVSVEEVRAGGVRVCAVGPSTGEALAAEGLAPDLLPGRYRAEGVVQALLGEASVRGMRVLLPRAEEGREVIPRELRAAGATVEVVPAYRTDPEPEGAARLADLVGRGEVDLLTFTAGSAARSFAASWRARGAGVLPEGIGVVALGPATVEALREEGLPVHRTADPHTLEGLVSAIERWAQRRSGR